MDAHRAKSNRGRDYIFRKAVNRIGSNGKNEEIQEAIMAKPEYNLCKAIADYLRLQYPHVEYRFDLAGLCLSKAQAGMNKALQKRRGFPDLQIMEPRGQYHGAFFEIKAEGVRSEKKNGEFASDHIEEQAAYLSRLMERGYYARFVVGFDDAKSKIDYYINLKPIYP